MPIGIDFISPGVVCDPINLRFVNGTNSTDAIARNVTAESESSIEGGFHT